MEIPIIRGLKWAQILGQPCEFYLVARHVHLPAGQPNHARGEPLEAGFDEGALPFCLPHSCLYEGSP